MVTPQLVHTSGALATFAEPSEDEYSVRLFCHFTSVQQRKEFDLGETDDQTKKNGARFIFLA